MMNHIQSRLPAETMDPRQGGISDAQVAAYMRKQSVSTSESLEAGLTIQTREGDIVTLSSSSYAQMDALLYDSKGVLNTASGSAAISNSLREITLQSGEQFAFSVQGDLSASELEDIEDIVKNIDAIISEVAQGDMDDAVAMALSMGGYDTVSSYSADITYQKTYAARTEVQAQTQTQTGAAQEVQAAPAPEILPKENVSTVPSVNEPFPENHRPSRKKQNTIRSLNQFIEKIAEKLENIETSLVEKAAEPVESLFEKHLSDMEEKKEGKTPGFAAVESMMDKVLSLMDKITKEAFEGKFSELME